MEQPDKQKKSFFPYRPELKYLAIFFPAILSVPVITTIIFYYFFLPAWLETNSGEFQNIKNILIKYGKISSKEGEEFSASNISSANNTYTKEAVRLAQFDLGGLHLLLKLILPLIFVLGIFIWATLCYRIPGVSKSSDPDIRRNQEEPMDYLQEPTLDYLNQYNGVIITVNGFIISILGGFLVTSGLNNFCFFLGFETIVFSLIASLLAYPSFINFSLLRKRLEKKTNEIRLYQPLLPRYFKIATFASACLILGLVMLVASFLMA